MNKSLTVTVIARPKTLAQQSSSYFKCEACGRVYLNPKSLGSHQLNECGKEPRFQCMVCKRRFHQKNNMVRHLRTVHRDIYTADMA
ncbi:longitudinals lacking protein, isoforms A/B/D/L-like [Homalodisca vitripennis]|uniref:longitudinals lacking protein, isoforms A/B/D/L-like n=1 Tax=Homalodisca vitripennis TaxID=197043 RepID=UPI001EECE5B7|nr:longitudinals lacking protein, isoforms A/B/D/L-like [Homalodisca vitripennis]